MPAKTRERYTELKWMTKKGEIESKSHWIDLAKGMGMCDTKKGIFLNKPMKLVFPTTCPKATSPIGDIGTGATGNDQGAAGGESILVFICVFIY